MWTWGPQSLSLTGFGWNPGDKDADVALTNSNLSCAVTNPAQGAVRAITSRDVSGHWYFEVTPQGGGGFSADGSQMIGIGQSTADLSKYPGFDGNGRGYWGASGQKYVSAAGTAYGSPWGAISDVVGVEVSAGALIFWLKVLGVMTSQGTAYTGLSGDWFPMWGTDTGSAGTRGLTINTGYAPFENLPAGASAWG